MKTIVFPHNVGILKLNSYIPQTRMKAEEIAKLAGLDKQTIVDSSGTFEKRVADKDEHPTNMAVYAAKDLLSQTKIMADDIDFIIYAGNALYDYQFWSPAAKIQSELNAIHAFAFDINNGCTSALTGLFLAANLLRSDSLNCGLILTSDTVSKFVNYKDVANTPFFSASDGANALIVKKNYSECCLVSAALHSNGEYVDLCKIRAGGTREINHQNTSTNFIEVDVNNKKMAKLINGGEFADNYVKVIEHALKAANINLNEVSFFLFNQVSKRVMNKVLASLNINDSRTLFTCEKFGHMTIDTLFALENIIKENKVQSGDYVVLAGAGIGFHWHACVVRI